ncbi:pilus assembly protein TadG-related protein [Cellulomonas sp. McL0617]|uniref:pilus assembly protein TadG-related protein n=1 Tax=Cellulomonas sp. McL0617 TaxID=3415675 RepID=UPI003CEC4382
MKARRDDGQVMLLTLGFVVIALLLISVVASAAHVHLERKRLLALADVLALEGADAVASDRYYAPGADRQPGVPLTDATVRREVEQYLRDNPDATAQWDQFTVLSATTPDGSSAYVHLGAVTHPVLLSWVLAPWQDGIALEAESSARAS